MIPRTGEAVDASFCEGDLPISRPVKKVGALGGHPWERRLCSCESW